MAIPEIIITASRELRKNMTKAEKLLWGYLRDNQLWEKILRQKPIHISLEDNSFKRYIIADFYIPSRKIIIEIDGNIHNHKEVVELDKVKEDLLKQKWYQILRFSNDEINQDTQQVLKNISSLLEKGRCPKDRWDDWWNTELQNFLKRQSDKQKLIVIYGPTGAGKTAMSIDIAKQLDTEIISTDSRQIYRGMDIGTGKISEEEMQGVEHHMIDVIDPDEKYSVGAFKKQAEAIIDELYKKWKTPMLVGGTGLYIDSIIFDMNIWNIPSNPVLREKFENLSDEDLYRWFQDIDPEYASEVHPNNRPYIERGIEVMMTSWKSKRDLREEKVLKYDILFLTPEWPQDNETTYREWLYERINTRVKQMFDEGLEQEVKNLIVEWYIEEDEGMRAIGYQEFFPYLRAEISKEECMQQVQQHSRNYAKRQLNWFSKYKKYRG